MEKESLKGIEGFFSDFEGAVPPNTEPVRVEKHGEQNVGPETNKEPPKHRKQVGPDRKERGTQRVKARQGRPPGIKSSSGKPKAKATFYVSASLIDFYRDWSWEERCNVGELVERALRDYKKRQESAGDEA